MPANLLCTADIEMVQITWRHRCNGKADKEKAARLYDAIDNSKIFVGTAKPEDRSIMNVCFVLRPEYAELDKKFLEFTGERGIVGIKGHRSVGGFRASIYNAMPMESVQVLIDAMKDFENNSKFQQMKILVATEKPFAAVAVEGIRKEVEQAGHELVLLEKGTKDDLVKAVADVDGLIVRSDIVDTTVLDAAKI